MSQHRSQLALPSDFAKKIADTLNWKLNVVEEMLDFTEDKEGYFWATLKPKKNFDKPDFIAVCSLTRDLGGEDYLKGAKAWKVPGAYVKKGPTASEEKPSGHGIDSQPAYKQPDNALPRTPSGLTLGQVLFTILPIKGLLSMPFQSRKDIEGSDFADLIESVKTVGILEPILVRPKTTEDFEIVAGERRVAAAKKAGLAQVPAIIKLLSDQEAYEIQLVENVQRKDLTDMEKARMLDMMITKFSYTQEQLAKKLGKSQPWVSQHLAMLQIPDNITRVIKHGEMTEFQAREILAAPEEKREEILSKIEETGVVPSSREIREVAKSIPCARCGEAAEHPVNLQGRFYCAACAEAVVEEAKETSIAESHVGPFEEELRGALRQPAVEPEVPSRAKPVGVQIGEFQCTECHQRFLIDHMPNGEHKLRPIKEAGL